MSAANSHGHYGWVAKSFHWLMAFIILTLLPMGVVAQRLPFDTAEQLSRKVWLFQIHKTLGIAAFFVALLRILWALRQEKPAPLHPERRLETFAADVAHWVLYGAIVLVPLTGWIHHAATEGFAPILWPFGQSLPFVPKSETVAALFGSLHYFFAILLALTLLAHIGGALKHAFIDRDQTLRRMLPGQAEPGHIPVAVHSRLPAFLAAAAFAGITAFAVLTADSGGHDHSHDYGEPTLSQTTANGNWQVQDGTLSITVKQLGSDVSGGFADWQADINFDETVTEGVAGTVTVRIAIASLTLGSVTGQALEADYFDAAAFPEATFTGEISVTGGAYQADGELTLKGVTQNLTFPFELTISGDQATMNAKFDLQRLDFNIGTSQPDEGSLGFGVGVVVDLKAARIN